MDCRHAWSGNRGKFEACMVDVLLPFQSVLCTLADSHEADLSVYGNVFVRPLATSSSTSSGRRRLQQTGTPTALISLS